MKLKSFLKYVEIQTKTASMIPFALGTLYAVYRFKRFDYISFFLMLISLLTFDMTTTAINNYIDYKKARKTSGYGYEKHNAIVRDNIRESTAFLTIVLLLTTAMVFGIILFLRSGPVVLFLGVISFGAGVFYTFGPVPISRMPLGEIFSGFFLGFINIFLSAYIHLEADQLISVNLSGSVLALNINLWELLLIFLFSLPSVFGIANIMLANNICDVEEDIENKRYTLVVYIGRARSLKLFRALYYMAFLDVILLVALRLLPVYALLVLLTFMPVYSNLREFDRTQTKKETFVFSVKNFMLINIALIVLVAAGTVLYI